jgi:DnaJ family protein B protein 4
MSGGSEEKVLEVEIQPGWKPGTKVRFPRAGNEVQEGESQDLVFVIEEKPHELFQRNENYLVCKMEIPLVDALARPSGLAKKAVQALDGRKLQVAIPDGIVKPGQETRISGEGMPIRKDGIVKRKGDLIVKWDVKFPERLTPAQKEGIRKVLG